MPVQVSAIKDFKNSNPVFPDNFPYGRGFISIFFLFQPKHSIPTKVAKRVVVKVILIIGGIQLNEGQLKTQATTYPPRQS